MATRMTLSKSKIDCDHRWCRRCEWYDDKSWAGAGHVIRTTNVVRKSQFREAKRGVGGGARARERTANWWWKKSKSCHDGGREREKDKFGRVCREWQTHDEVGRLGWIWLEWAAAGVSKVGNWGTGCTAGRQCVGAAGRAARPSRNRIGWKKAVRRMDEHRLVKLTFNARAIYGGARGRTPAMCGNWLARLTVRPCAFLSLICF